jgi:SAM-dependent methyltransferase
LAACWDRDAEVDGQAPLNTDDAVRLVEGAIPRRAGTWADLGAGDGTFTRALVELLGARSRIYAVDRDTRALSALARWAKREAELVIPIEADFTTPFTLPGQVAPRLDGLFFANALHFVGDAQGVVSRLVEWLRPEGRVVIVEYDQRARSRWVPYPIPREALPALVEFAGLSAPVFTATRPSAYGGDLYVAYAELGSLSS